MIETMISFKTMSALAQWHALTPGLKQVLFFIRPHWPDPYSEVTRIGDPIDPFSPGNKESGVHLYVLMGWGLEHLAIDLRTNDLTVEQGEEMENRINEEFAYNDPRKVTRRVARQHGEDKERHLHLQFKPGQSSRRVERIDAPSAGGPA